MGECPPSNIRPPRRALGVRVAQNSASFESFPIKKLRVRGRKSAAIIAESMTIERNIQGMKSVASTKSIPRKGAK
jgi:hypothetical protein